LDGVFNSQYSAQHVSAGVPATFSVMLLLQQHKTYKFDCVTITPLKFRLKPLFKVCEYYNCGLKMDSY